MKTGMSSAPACLLHTTHRSLPRRPSLVRHISHPSRSTGLRSLSLLLLCHLRRFVCYYTLVKPFHRSYWEHQAQQTAGEAWLLVWAQATESQRDCQNISYQSMLTNVSVLSR